MGGIAETLGKGKGQPRDPKGGLKGQVFGEAAQQRAGADAGHGCDLGLGSGVFDCGCPDIRVG